MTESRFHGDSCKACGKTLRYVKGRKCVSCEKARSRADYQIFQAAHGDATSAWHEANRERHNEIMRAGQLKRKFGLTVGEYDLWLSAQNGACAICRRCCPTGRRLAVDHDHATDHIRGLLCQGCNTGIGKFGDDPDRLEAAARYLRLAAQTNHLPSDRLDTTIGLIHRAEKAQ